MTNLKTSDSLAKRARIGLLRLLLAGRFQQHDVYLISSSPRSGSTLFANVVSTLLDDSCILFEPLHLTRVPEAERSGFEWRTFRSPEEEWASGEIFLKQVFEGRVINSWTTREMTRFTKVVRAKRIVCKFVRIARLLPWLNSRFKIPSPLHLIRHPCAVVASQLNYGWKGAKQPEIPDFLREYPEFVSALKNTRGDEEYLAARWALDQLVPLLWNSHSSLQIITYENLILEPEKTLSEIASNWSVEVDIEPAISQLDRPSSVVSASGICGVRGWKKSLSNHQICRILDTVKSFGLDFYSTDEVPDLTRLLNTDLASHISQAGTK